jgi:hypothetical protein
MRFGVSETPTVVFDTQIFLRALINFKSACGKLVFNRGMDYILYTANQIEKPFEKSLFPSNFSPLYAVERGWG